MRISLALLILLAVVLVVAGCGSPASTTTCNPPCAAGLACDANGTCVAVVTEDLSVTSVVDMQADLAMGCNPACAKGTFCNAAFRCVACLVDGNCPVGQVCKTSGNTAACVPGCATDDRCRGADGGASMSCCGAQCVDTGSDAANCGACGTACSVVHAAPSCTAGLCGIGACEAGWADCNKDQKDGCEANLHVDQSNCAACGKTCKLANAVAGCSDGCYLAACLYGFDDCDGDPTNGCEASVLTNAKNCGKCSYACPSPAHGNAVCAGALCAIASCSKGFADCDGNFADGCEANLATDSNNCSACGLACPMGQVCVNSACTCPQCNFPNAKSACVNQMCVLVSCNQNFGDCDGNAVNGCELPLSTDAKNCGACGNVCAMGLVCLNGGCTCPMCVNIPHAITACMNNVCSLVSCVAGYGDCDKNVANGCEVDLTAANANCGACGTVCPNNLPHCVNSVCVQTPQYVGTFDCGKGPAWGNNPPCYTCLEACALIFGGNAVDYSCSTMMNSIDHMSNASIWGVGGCQKVAEDFKKNVNYNCGNANCAESSYVTDNCSPGTNYCFK